MAVRRSNAKHATRGAAMLLLVFALASAILWQLGSTRLVPAEPGTPATSSVDSARNETFFTTSDVNLRSGPGTSFDVLSVVPVQRQVVVTGEVQQGFLPVRTQGVEAWISADHLSPGGVTLSQDVAVAMPTETPEPTQEPAVVMDEAEAASENVMNETVEVAAPAVIADDPGPVTANLDVTTPAGERWVEVDRSTATVTLHQGGHVVAEFPGLIGKDPSADGYYATAVGTYYVFSKNRELTETPFAPGVYLTDWVGFDPDRSNGFHSPTRDARGNVVQTGGTTTLGCVRLSEEDARTMYDFAFIGMRVEVYD